MFWVSLEGLFCFQDLFSFFRSVQSNGNRSMKGLRCPIFVLCDHINQMITLFVITLSGFHCTWFAVQMTFNLLSDSLRFPSVAIWRRTPSHSVRSSGFVIEISSSGLLGSKCLLSISFIVSRTFELECESRLNFNCLHKSAKLSLLVWTRSSFSSSISAK